MRVAVLISGRGSNLQAILEAEKEKRLGDAEVYLIISSNPNAAGLDFARNQEKYAIVLNPEDYTDKTEYFRKLKSLLLENDIELIVLAGFMKVLSYSFVDYFKNKIINIHPSLLPAFSGLKVHERVLEYGVKYSGCTVHFVNEEIDGGPIIGQKIVEVLEEDTPESLAAKILVEEHILLPEVIKKISENKISVNQRRVKVN
ncbi:MAG: phosphoribosylglycinamide formyltransferase [Candidatus Heimdallarchaeaceae archaeon]